MFDTGYIEGDEGSVPTNDTVRTWRYELSFLPSIVWHYTSPLRNVRLLAEYLRDEGTLYLLPGDAATERYGIT